MPNLNFSDFSREIEVDDSLANFDLSYFSREIEFEDFFGKSEFIDFSPEIEFYIFFLANFNFSIFLVKLNLRNFWQTSISLFLS